MAIYNIFLVISRYRRAWEIDGRMDGDRWKSTKNNSAGATSVRPYTLPYSVHIHRKLSVPIEPIEIKMAHI